MRQQWVQNSITLVLLALGNVLLYYFTKATPEAMPAVLGSYNLLVLTVALVLDRTLLLFAAATGCVLAICLL